MQRQSNANTKQPVIYISEEVYKFLMDITKPSDLKCTASLGEFVSNNTLEKVREAIEHEYNKKG